MEECANSGSLAINENNATLTIDNLTCTGLATNLSARLVIRKGIEVLFVSSENVLFPESVVTFHNTA